MAVVRDTATLFEPPSPEPRVLHPEYRIDTDDEDGEVWNGEDDDVDNLRPSRPPHPSTGLLSTRV